MILKKIDALNNNWHKKHMKIIWHMINMYIFYKVKYLELS